jgi:hypothetical protein
MDAIRRHLARRGVAPYVLEGGIDGLVRSWERITSQVEGGSERWMWEEWLNELDGREIIQDLFDNVPESRVAVDAVERADRRFAASTTPTDECEWGAENAARYGWTREKNWWYWRKPRADYL